MGQLSSVPQLLSLCSATREATAMRNSSTVTESSPHLPQLEKNPCTKIQQQRLSLLKFSLPWVGRKEKCRCIEIRTKKKNQSQKKTGKNSGKI